MTIYRTFLDDSTAAGAETILGVQQDGSEYGVGISSNILVENLYVINSIGIGTTNAKAKLHSYGTVGVGETEVLGFPVNTLIEVEDGNPWAIGFRRTDLGPKYDVAAFTDSDGTFYIESGDGVTDEYYRLLGISTNNFRVYTNNNISFRVDSNANSLVYNNLLVGTQTLTGTPNQRLQVSGGAYINGNVGIGITSPTATLEIRSPDYAWFTLNGTGSSYPTEAELDFRGTNVYNYIYSKGPELWYHAGYDSSNGNTGGFHRFMVAYNGGSGIEKARINVNGITFNGDTAAANALNDYERGTFTMTVIGSTTPGTASYTQDCSYVKIGDLVQFEAYIEWTSGTGTGGLKFAGLPFVSRTTGGLETLPAVTVAFPSWVNTNSMPTAYINSGTNQIDWWMTPTISGGSSGGQPYIASGGVGISGTYRIP